MSTESAPPNPVPASKVDSASPGKDANGQSAPLGLAAPPLPATAPSSAQLGLGLLTAGLVIAALYFGRDILMPLALAFLLGFLLDPLVGALKRRRVPRTMAVVIVIVSTLSLLVVAGVLLSNQVRSLSAELPTYQSNIRYKLRELRSRINAPGMFDGAVKTFEAVKSEVESQTEAATGGRPARAAPQRVLIEDRPVSPLTQTLQRLEVAAGALATSGIVLVFVVLVLLDRQDLRFRLLRLLGGNLHRTTDAIDEAGSRISKYLTMQFIINLSYGVPLAAGLTLIGVPGAILWGAVAAVMRFVPYLGPMIAALFPLTLAFAVDPGWDMLLWTLALIVVLELIINNLIEPWLYGASTGLSAMSLLVSATFWTALWGPAGLVLSTPLTVCLLVIGRHLPQLQFLNVLLGSQPALDAPTRVYQRLLAGDVEEAIDLASDDQLIGGAIGFYHQVGVPALRQASDDHDSVASAEHRHRVVSGMDQVIDELRELHPPPQVEGPASVICIGGKWEIDTLAARMLAHAIALSGVPADHRAASLSKAEFFNQLDLKGATTVCLSLFSAQPHTQVRYLCRRLRRRWPDLHILLALWNAPADLLVHGAGKALGADSVCTSIDEAVLRIQQQGGSQAVDGYLEAPVPEHDAERVRALRASGLLTAASRQQFDLAAKRASDVFDFPLAMVSLVGEEQQEVCGASGGLAAQSGGEAAVPRSLSMCAHVVASGESLVVPDIARDPRFAQNPALLQRGLRFYAGAPLRDAAGSVYGALCVFDTQPREFTRRDVRLLEAMANDLMDVRRFQVPTTDTSASRDLDPASAPREDPPSATVGQSVPS